MPHTRPIVVATTKWAKLLREALRLRYRRRMGTSGDVAYETDLSMWPLVVWRMRRVLTVPEFQSYLGEVERIVARKERYAQVVVSCLGEGRSALTAETRKLQASWVKRHFCALEQHCAAMGVVISDMSPITHFTVSVLMSVLGRTPAPSKIMTGETEALAWARGHLAKASGPAKVPSLGR